MDPIEVEVVEIDGRKPPPPGRPAPETADGSLWRADPWTDDDPGGSGAGSAAGRVPWRQWSGSVRTIPPVLWPVVFVLGAILLAVLVTAGLAIGILFLILRTLIRALHALFR
jgi:hypothetical protein